MKLTPGAGLRAEVELLARDLEAARATILRTEEQRNVESARAFSYAKELDELRMERTKCASERDTLRRDLETARAAAKLSAEKRATEAESRADTSEKKLADVVEHLIKQLLWMADQRNEALDKIDVAEKRATEAEASMGALVEALNEATDAMDAVESEPGRGSGSMFRVDWRKSLDLLRNHRAAAEARDAKLVADANMRASLSFATLVEKTEKERDEACGRVAKLREPLQAYVDWCTWHGHSPWPEGCLKARAALAETGGTQP